MAMQKDFLLEYVMMFLLFASQNFRDEICQKRSLRLCRLLLEKATVDESITHFIS